MNDLSTRNSLNWFGPEGLEKHRCEMEESDDSTQKQTYRQVFRNTVPLMNRQKLISWRCKLPVTIQTIRRTQDRPTWFLLLSLHEKCSLFCCCFTVCYFSLIRQLDEIKHASRPTVGLYKKINRFFSAFLYRPTSDYVFCYQMLMS